MISTTVSRRGFLIGGAAVVATMATPSPALANPRLDVAKDPNCGCCSAWVAILEADGFDVAVETLAPADLAQLKRRSGVPQAMMSCHTGRIEGYVIEGHVPAADIRRLLETRPDAIGLSVPGMPLGSPGMGPEEAREAYQVFLIKRDGSTDVFASYAAA